MRQYPVRVGYDRYSGQDRRKREKALEFNRVAEKVEQYINDLVAKWDDVSMGSIMSHQVAAAIREDNDLVHRIIFSIDAGHNGVTIYKGDYERAMTPKPQSAG